MKNGTRGSTTRMSVVIFLGLMSVFESTSAKYKRTYQLTHQVRIESSEFKDDIHVDDTPIEDLQVGVINEGPSAKAPSKLRLILTSLRPPFGKASNHQPPQRLLGSGITSKLFPSTPSHSPPDPDSLRPDLPPSPVPAPPAFDKFVDRDRVLVQFSLDPKDNQRNYTIRAKISVTAAPGARFSGLTFGISLADGTILAIPPENIVGPKTEAEIRTIKNL